MDVASIDYHCTETDRSKTFSVYLYIIFSRSYETLLENGNNTFI